jgi:hypothetical protein
MINYMEHKTQTLKNLLIVSCETKETGNMKKNQKKETEKTVRAAIEKYSKKYGYNALTPSEREFIGGQITFKEFKKRYAGIK